MDKRRFPSLLPLEFTGSINIVSSSSEERDAVKFLRKENLVGFDTESPPSDERLPRNPPCLIQVATRSDAFIWRLESGRFPEQLKLLVEDVCVLKICQGAINEVTTLHRAFDPLQPKGFICLHNIASSLRCSPKSLQGLAAIFLNKHLDKSLATSNWAAPLLSDAQMRYAATDAWAVLEILHAMREAFKVDRLPQEVPVSSESLGLSKPGGNSN